jgi:predicted ATPase/DNA-binding winged helix-turn-helix (wHTH) protein
VRATFAEFEVDTMAFELRRGGDVIPLEPQVFEVLAHLVRHHDRVVTKGELLDTVWGDRFVSESALTTRIKHVRQAIGDDGQRQALVRTVHGRGYRFVADVVVLTDDATTVDKSAAVVEGRPRSNLPAERTPLLGRESEVARVEDVTEANRLVTVLGLGGTGKTRLALAVALRVRDRYPDGVWFVDLVPAGDERSVETALAHDLGLALSTGDARPQLARLLATRRTLIVLDNCEHVLSEIVALLDHLLAHTSGPHFLATSREPLDLPEEQRVILGPLAVGDWDTPAMALFRSSAQRFGAEVDDAEEATVERICRHLDGLPLAIELAAAQMRVLAPKEIANRLDQRFELLHEPGRAGRARHTSLEAVLEDTWALLDAGEQELTGRLATFAGAFSVADAEALCDDMAPGTAARGVARLIDLSLVVRESAGGRRIWLLESVRMFAASRTNHDAAVRRHADWCRRQVRGTLADHLFDFDVAHWCVTHFDDVRTAERGLAEQGRYAAAAQLLSGTALAMHTDNGARAVEVLGEIDRIAGHVDDPTWLVRLHLTGVLCGMATRSPETIAAHSQAAIAAADVTGDPALRSLALVHGSWATVLVDPEQALRDVEEGHRLADRAGHEPARDLADSYRAFYLDWLHRYDEAIAQAEAVAGSPPLTAAAGQASFVSVTMLAACDVATRPQRARAWLEALLTLPTPEQPMWGNLVVGAAILASNGETRECIDLAERVRGELDAAGQDWLPDLLVPAIALAHHQGDGERARRWVRAVRDAGRPTQSFPVTCAYRRLRHVTGIATDPVLAGTTLEAIGEEALAWMSDQG